MKPEHFKVTAPPDDVCDQAYSQIAEIARNHALIVQAAGGVMTIATPDAQRSHEGTRDNVLRMHCMNEVEISVTRQMSSIILKPDEMVIDVDDL